VSQKEVKPLGKLDAISVFFPVSKKKKKCTDDKQRFPKDAERQGRGVVGTRGMV
jgi:hypothetical protein